MIQHCNRRQHTRRTRTCSLGHAAKPWSCAMGGAYGMGMDRSLPAVVRSGSASLSWRHAAD